jgi:hypothetical protein
MTNSRAEDVEEVVSASVAEDTTSVGGRHTEALEKRIVTINGTGG